MTALAAAADDPRLGGRDAAALGQIHNRDAAPALLKLATGDGPPLVRANAVQALSTSGSHEQAPALIRLLTDSAQPLRVRIESALTLGALREDTAVPAMRLRRAVSQGLGEIATPDARAALAAAVYQESVYPHPMTKALATATLLLAACTGPQHPLPAAAPELIFEAQAVGPLTNPTELQIVSLFSFEPGEQLITPAKELAAFVAKAREEQGYGKVALQPLLVPLAPGTIGAKQLLVIAWGPRSEFSLARAREVGQAAMRETLKLGVAEMAYAPVARDQGVTTLAADEVAAAFVEGAMREFIVEAKTAAPGALHLRHVVYEAGPAFVDAVSRATVRGVEAAHAP